VRPASELVGLAETHPDVDSDIDPKFLHIVFFDRAPSSATVGAIDRDRFTPDRFVVVDRHAFVTYPNGSARSKLTIDVFERACAVTGTARNLNSVRKVADLT